MSIDRSRAFYGVFQGQPGRLIVPARQFAAGDFPPICAATGLPADTRRKFRFFKAPGWSVVFVLLMLVGIGFVVSGLLIFLVADRSTGYLPLTSASKRRLDRVLWISVWMLIGSAIVLLAGAALSLVNDPLASLVGLQLLILGVLAFIFSFTGLQIGLGTLRPLYGPSGVIVSGGSGATERWIELRNVHPAFVTAVQQQHAARAGQASQAG